MKSIVVVDKNILGVFTVKGISFSIDKRERMVVLSANNSGASSLIQSVLGLQIILSGNILVDSDCEIKKKFN